MPPRHQTPPTPSPSVGHSEPESLYTTPSAPLLPRQARVSPPPSPASTIRTPDQPTEPTLEGTPRPISIPVELNTSDSLTLHEKSQLRTHAFRVYSPVVSPDSSLIWTGNSATSGFFPYNAHLAVFPSVYVKVMPRITETPGWEHGPYVRHTMVDHINGKMRQGLLNIPSHLEERPGTPEDEKSPWISGTRSLMWAIWEVARRLAWDEGVVGMSVIKLEGMTADQIAAEWMDIDIEAENGMSELERWRRAEERTRRGFIAKEVLVSPLRPISMAIGSVRAGEMSFSMKEAYEMALRSARESEEVLWYGRVFAESVERNVEFSTETFPIELPPQFYKPSRSNSNRQRLISPIANAAETPGLRKTMADDASRRGLEGWLSRLVWDPRSDEYERAVQKVVERRRQLYISRGVTRENCPLTPM